MAIPSNLYAEKIFAEHPICLWTFDDKADYISLILENQRDLVDWDISGANVSIDTLMTSVPFEDSIVNAIEGNLPIGPYNEIKFIGPDLSNFLNLSTYYSTFCVGTYVYIDSAFTESISIGYEYTDSSTMLTVEKVKEHTIDTIDEWIFVSGTFDVLNENATIRPIIKIKTLAGGASQSDYRYYINGTTVGQWSEEFNRTSLGINKINFPNNIALDQDYAVEAEAYSIANDPAYYLVSNNSLLAKNTSIPMVFGASGITKLIPNEDKPSLIFPGKGFLNKVGQFNEYTVEFWARINSDTKTPKRIFGPIASSDGLYVESGFLTLVIGNKFTSYFIGEWFRPMLIDIRLIRNFASVLINGEEVMSMAINTNDLILPDEYNEENKNQDWLGIYTYDNVFPIEVDCIAIYSYQVSISMAKRRYVYGQGVVSPEGINSAYSGTTAFIDYSFSDYTSNYTYPNFAEWSQGSYDNLVAGDLTLSTPNYKLPEIFIDNKKIEELYADNKAIQGESQNKFITFRPNENWNSQTCYFNFPQFNILGTPINSIYGIFQSSNLDTQEILFKIYNVITKDYFLIIKDNDEIKYLLNYNGIEEELYSSAAITSGQKFAAGIQINIFANEYGGNISTFFGNQNGLKIYVAGDDAGTKQFTGNIYSIGICTDNNAEKITNYFESNGTAIANDFEIADSLLLHTASYTLIPLEAYDAYFLDIGVSGHWEDYMPLSYFGQFVNDQTGADYYDLDFLQFNIGYPAPSVLKEIETISSWSYRDLQSQYQHPVVYAYEQFDNTLITQWNDYTDLSQRSVKYYQYDTNGSLVKSYITFQYVDEGANKLITKFTNEEPLKANGVIDLTEYNGWTNTKFNVVDNTIIYPNKSVDFTNIAIVYRLEFDVRGILTKPISLRKLEISSEALNNNSFNPIGTKFGINLFPYTKAGLYYDYKAKNPFSIYKSSTPYLYLNRTSGIEIRGDFDRTVSRGISMPINTGLAPKYSISAIQMWMRYDKDLFPGIAQELFEIQYLDDTIKFYFIANSEKGNRGLIYAKSDLTGKIYENLTYYLNGQPVKDPVITSKEWSVLGIRFDNALLFNSFLGGLNLTGPMIFNNIAYYQANNLQRVQSTRERAWADVKTDYTTDPDTQYTWANWWGTNEVDGKYSWLGVLVTGTLDYYGVNPSLVYKTYLGTNKIILDDNEGFEFIDDNIFMYSDVLWQISESEAV